MTPTHPNLAYFMKKKVFDIYALSPAEAAEEAAWGGCNCLAVLSKPEAPPLPGKTGKKTPG
jgi:hypothetical protein